MPNINIVFEGDSLTNGVGSSATVPPGMHAYPYQTGIRLKGGGNTFNIVNLGTAGIALPTLFTNYATRAGASFNPGGVTYDHNILVFMAGTNTAGANDSTAVQKYQYIRGYLRLALTTGYDRIIVGTIPARGDNPAYTTGTLATLNAYLQSYWNNDLSCDGLLDFVSNPHFATVAAASNALYYQADLLHSTDLGYRTWADMAASVIRPILTTAGPRCNAPASWSPVDSDVGNTLSNSNKTFAYTSQGQGMKYAQGLPQKTAGKWYFEISADNVSGIGDAFQCGISTNSFSTFTGMQHAYDVTVVNDGTVIVAATTVLGANSSLSSATGDILCFAFDRDAKLFWCRRNRAGALSNWNNSGTANPATGAGGVDISTLSDLGAATGYIKPCGGVFTSPNAITTKLATADLSQAPPSGFLAIGDPIAATQIVVTGPNSGANNAASSNFTAQLNGSFAGTVNFWPTSIFGTFSPESLALVAGVPQTFTFTPTAAGDRPIAFANDQGLANWFPLTYTDGSSGTSSTYAIKLGPVVQLSAGNAVPAV